MEYLRTTVVFGVRVVIKRFEEQPEEAETTMAYTYIFSNSTESVYAWSTLKNHSILCTCQDVRRHPELDYKTYLQYRSTVYDVVEEVKRC